MRQKLKSGTFAWKELRNYNFILKNKTANRLKDSLSPYLIQHAYNPVDWHEWGEEAFALAERENKLMLISIGYSACHWCHVMAHESFEDQETAEIMNKYFVCIKIDREEFPDVDQIYMDACQLVNGSGGWPLNAFTLPDKRPIHAMTYAPKAQWQEILNSIQNLWLNKESAAYGYAEKLSHGIKNLSLPPLIKTEENKVEKLSPFVLESFKTQFDGVYGGSKRAPKFPLPSNWQFLLKYGEVYSDNEAKEMALFTLKQMALGGIYDAVAGGFSRYSVDQKWFAPHFEKMLYDNAQLISVFAYGYAVSKNPFYKKIALDCLHFCKKEWKTNEGIYQSALDADSEGVEGLYYTYTFEELQTILGEAHSLFCAYFQCSEAGNWEHRRNILYPIKSLEEAAIDFDIQETVFKETIENNLSQLYYYRSARIAPGLDDKCISAWNNLQLKALANSALYFDSSELLEEAIELESSISKAFYIDGKLKRISKNGAAKIEGFLEDYATNIEGLLELYQVSLAESYLLKAKALTEQCIHLFYREEKRYFSFTETNNLIAEKFDINDDVISSGNSIMANNLYTLSWYFDKEDWRLMSLDMLHGVSELLQKSGPWYSHWAALSLRAENPCIQHIISTNTSSIKDPNFNELKTNPNTLFGYVGAGTEIPLFKGKEYQGKNFLYRCEDKTCGLPVNF
jgi:uncharacterized protein YyaL (SSP411 family)